MMDGQSLVKVRSTPTVEIRSTVATRCQRRSVTISLVGAVCYATSTGLLSLAGVFTGRPDPRLVAAGIVAFVVAAGLGVLREWAQRWVNRGQQSAAANLRIAVKDALRPVAEQIAEMQSLTPGQRRTRLPQVAQQVAGSMDLLLRDIDGLRTVVYELKDGGQRMEPLAYQGRGDKPGAFERHGRGKPDGAFETLEQNEPRLVHDLRVGKELGRRQHGVDRHYLTYIAVPIVVGATGYGLLTLDAPQEKSFTETDLYLCEFVAELLGIAFACASL
jgi:transcriptional regulator with GAF, ATPase, and Fis domain